MTESHRSQTPGPDAAAPDATDAPVAARRPMARATRIALFEREVRERLSRAALELVLGRAEVISEGQRGVRNGRDAYFGSTMLTIDLPSLDLLLRDACDAGTARRLAELLDTQTPVLPHSPPAGQRPRGSAELSATLPHVPLPLAAHDWQVPQLVVVQQTPSVQLPVVHSCAAPQAAPFPFLLVQVPAAVVFPVQ